MVNYTYSTPSEAGYNLSQGVDKFFGWIIFQDPSFLNYFILMIWCIIFIGGTFTEKRLTSREEYSKWGLLASLVSFVISLLFGFTTDFNAGYAIATTLGALIVFIIIEFRDAKII